MNNQDLSSLFEQISRLEKTKSTVEEKKIDSFQEDLEKVLYNVADEIQRVLGENDFTQDDLCKITGMSQSNISKILNVKVVPRIETLQKIASATNTKLVISFENVEGDDE